MAQIAVKDSFTIIPPSKPAPAAARWLFQVDSIDTYGEPIETLKRLLFSAPEGACKLALKALSLEITDRENEQKPNH